MSMLMEDQGLKGDSAMKTFQERSKGLSHMPPTELGKNMAEAEPNERPKVGINCISFLDFCLSF